MLRFIKRLLYGAGFIGLLLLSGCASNSAKINSQSVESCGSNTAYGQYYDFRTGQCVIPAKNDFNKLYYYAQLSRIAKFTNQLMDFQVIYNSSTTAPDVLGSLDDLHPIAVKSIIFYFPTIDIGLTSGVTFNQPFSNSSELIKEAKKYEINKWDKMTVDWPEGKKILDSFSSVFEKGEYQIPTDQPIVLTVTPQAALAWWVSHQTTVSFVQPISSPLSEPYQSKDFFKK